MHENATLLTFEEQFVYLITITQQHTLLLPLYAVCRVKSFEYVKLNLLDLFKRQRFAFVSVFFAEYSR